MTHTYNITGMTCSGCAAKVQKLLLGIKEIQSVDISVAKGTAAISMRKHVPTIDLQVALKDYPKYQLSDTSGPHHAAIDEDTREKLWLNTYKPILLIFGYILSITIITSFRSSTFDLMESMRIFMSGFFLIFSFFKLLDLPGFADSYGMYDVIAKRWKPWAYLYAFTELSLGILFALNVFPIAVNLVTFIVMIISLTGVLQSVLNKQKIQCACLGSVFNLPMSTVTIVEDGLMIAMSLFALAKLII